MFPIIIGWGAWPCIIVYKFAPPHFGWLWYLAIPVSVFLFVKENEIVKSRFSTMCLFVTS